MLHEIDRLQLFFLPESNSILLVLFGLSGSGVSVACGLHQGDADERKARSLHVQHHDEAWSVAPCLACVRGLMGMIRLSQLLAEAVDITRCVENRAG